MKEIKSFVVVVFFMLLLVFGLAYLGNQWEKGQVRQACSVFSQESGRKVKFVEYTAWNRDCLTKLDSGKWISTFNLRDSE